MNKLLQQKTNDLKQEIISVLLTKDLTGETFYIRDIISNFSGGCIDGEIGMLTTKVSITKHEGIEIDLENDFEEDLGTFELTYFGIELLLDLV